MTSTAPTSAQDRDTPAATALPTQYQPASVEGPLYERWVERGYFEAGRRPDADPFSLVIPPPNVTGSLHIGHAFEHTLIDAVVRRARMQGYDTLWLPGMDHASIAVHALVERQLAAEGTSRRELGRERFLERVWQWKNEYGGAILAQMRRLGDSVDWSRERFTMDEGMARAVRTMFKRLYDEGLIYRAERLVNWSPELRSVLSDAEVDHREVMGELITVRYGPADAAAGPSITVATTRVETMLGDTAVAVHPDDERYRHLVGQQVELPLTGRRIPIVADEHVDPEFGTGAVKVTPAHDPNDFEIGKRHRLPMLSIMDEQGRIVGTGTEFDGLDRLLARAAVRERLAEQGRIVAERPYLHSVGHSERSGEPIEPRLSLQWFVRVGPLAEAAGAAVREGRVRVSPPEMAGRYFGWVDNLHDWCISRQLWWGHRIPVWYSPSGEMACFGPDEQPPADWTQDPDVLDTWFSSALWPFGTLGWPEQTPELQRYYPTTLLITGYDILFFWVVRMMMFGLHAMDDRGPADSVPFRTFMLHGMVRDRYGKKMSKSKGNSVDPLAWMDAYGTDAVRFTFAWGANPGADMPLSEDNVAGSRNFCNKLWNATRFALLNGATTDGDLPAELTGPDAWIVSRLQEVIAEVDRLYDADYEFAKIADLLYHFAWDEVCDWYLELAKVALADPATAPTTRRVLGEVLDGLLRLLHPIVPFVTEALWTELTGAESIVIAPWPKADASRINPVAAAELAELQTVVLEVRRFRSEQGVKPSQRIPARFTGPVRYETEIRSLLRLTEPAGDFAPTAALATASGVRIELDLSTAIDVAAERARLTRDQAAAQKELEQTGRKLSNENFLANAKPEVVGSIRDRNARAAAELERIDSALAALPAR